MSDLVSIVKKIAELEERVKKLETKGVGGVDADEQKLMEELYIRAVKLILPDKKTTAFYLQRKLWIDLPRAKQILRMLVKNGVVS